MDVNLKTALVTGGASGIGAGIGAALLAGGARVILVDRNARTLEQTQIALRSEGDVHVRTLDVTSRDDVAALAAEVDATFGGVDILCNNAGVGGLGQMFGAGYEDWDRVLGVNLGGVINGIVEFVPRMIAHGRGGHIVNTASMAGLTSLPGVFGIYSTSKFAVVGLSGSLRKTLADKRIGVSVLCPGLVRSSIVQNENSHQADDPEVRAVLDQTQNIHAQGMDPMEVGNHVVAGIRSNQPYILTHGEFRDDLAAEYRAIIESFDSAATANQPEIAYFKN